MPVSAGTRTMKSTDQLYLIFALFLCLPEFAKGSLGDSFPFYKSCVYECKQATCEEDGYYRKVRSSSYFKELFEWQCVADCRYTCMWDLVEAFKRKGWNVPQFHGKWPFVRWLGLQEPVSMIASVVHLTVTVIMFRYFYKRVRSKSPMYWIWVTYALGISGFMKINFRVSSSSPNKMLLNCPSAMRVLFSVCCLLFFFNHTLYLTLDDTFDYAYNMKANIVLSIMTSIIVFSWTLREWKTLHHVRFALYYMINFIIAAIPEVLDFPPIWWAVDAHALWHILSIPVTYFLFRYGVEDCKYLHKSKLSL